MDIKANQPVDTALVVALSQLMVRMGLQCHLQLRERF